MSVPADHTDQGIATVPQSAMTPNWIINVSDIITVEVSNISPAVSEREIREFFSFSGDIQCVEMQRETDGTQLAYVTFKDSQGADTAVLLSDKRPIATGSAVQKAEDVVSTMLAKGFVLGKDAISKAKAFDEQHHLTSNASATVASIDRKMGLSEKLSIGTAIVNEKVREMDERFHVSEKTKSAFSTAELKAISAGSAIMSNHYVLTGASWVSNAYNAVAMAADDVTMMTKEKVGKAEEEKREIIYRERTGIINHFAHLHLDESSALEPPIVPVSSADDSKLEII
ncbi:binding partner of ACD11 1 isoform X3 [Juglans microcarpa x Juglans regia]|uniref:binding partner of ACD11 1 isoform X3 n=1 Tax=Juglans microcarpa x Juglans regia TaxID=2249226 RepID=UPI001B7DDBE3|nr:binding partner of ACD11 1 isoform X3 [Juglans microcarpa x Juglans regia]